MNWCQPFVRGLTISKKIGNFGEMLKGWFEKLAREEPALYRELAPGVRIHMNWFQIFNFFPPENVDP